MGNVARRGPITGISAWQAASQRARALVGKGRDRAAQRPAVPRHREDPADAARRAGDRGRHAQPMDTARRQDAYMRQTGRGGRSDGEELTPKQRRRANKKLIGELKRIPVAVLEV